MCSLQGRCSCFVTFSNVPRQRCWLFGYTWLRLFWKISWACGTIDQLFPWIGGCSCSRVPLAVNVTFCAAGFSWAFWTSHCFDFLSEWPYLLLQSDDNFELLPCTHWTKSISQGCLCLALSHQCPRFLLCWKYFFLWSAQFCFWDKFYEVIGHLQHWLVCQLLHKVCWAIQRCFVQASFDGAPRCWRFLRNLQFDRVDKVLRLSFRSLFRQLTFLLVHSVVAGGVSFAIGAQLETFSAAKGRGRGWVTFSETWSKNNRSRISSTLNVDLIKLYKIITYSESNTDVVGWTDEIHHHCYRWIIGVEMHVRTSFLHFSLLEIDTSSSGVDASVRDTIP